MMASSSRRSPPELKHNVFLSFRGEGTREGFVSHLHAALSHKKIKTFIDDELRRGHEISPALLNAIEGSKISVVIFSKSYASSGWCLDELVKILECKEEYGQFVIPVFYHIDPSDVRHQNGTFGKAFAKHETERAEKVPRWRNALTKAANLSGFDSNVIRPESTLLEKIIKIILEKLNDMSQVRNNNLVGIDSRIEDIIQSLDMELTSIRKVGIWGMGGIGKTTLACAVFDRVFKHFEASYCAQDVKEAAKIYSEWTHLRKELLFKILEDGDANVKFTSTKEKLSHKKVLILFDDVTSFNQIEELIGDLNCLGPWSRIIITSRDRQILKNCGVDKIHEITGLVDNDALQLFSRYAFKQNSPKVDFMDLSNRVVSYAQGLPLALKVLGSFLFDRTRKYWENALNKLKRIPHGDVQKVLQISYDGLDHEDKNSFRHISCFFRGWKRKLVEEILDACGFDPELGIHVLIERSLISISFGETIIMHDLIQEMGKEVVRQESIDDPGKRSRLWHHEDIHCMLNRNMGTEAIRGISLDMSKIKETYLNPLAFFKMHNLRFFEVYNTYYFNKLHDFDCIEYDFSELRYLYWSQYPFESLPPNFHAMNIVALDMPYGNLKQIEPRVQIFLELKYINLSHCKHLLKIPDLSQASNLENLSLQGCISLHEVPSIWYLNKVVVLNLTDCKSLSSSPTQIHSKSLRKVIFSGCSSLNIVPEIPCSVEELYLNETAIEELPSSIGCVTHLKVLSLENCSSLESLSNDLCELKSLKTLNLSGCSRLERLPNDLGNLKALEVIEANGIAIREVSHTLSGLPFLKKLSLSDCSITELPDSFGELSSLEYLNISRNNFTTVPKSFINLSKLWELVIINCNKLLSLPDLPSCLRYVKAEGCRSLQAVSPSLIPSSIWGKPHQTNFNCLNCPNLDWNVLRNVMDDAQLNLRRKRTRHFEFNKYFNCPTAGIIFPGNEIPEWFNIQSSGHLLMLPQSSFSHNFIGLVFCIVLGLKIFYSNGDILIPCSFVKKRQCGSFEFLTAETFEFPCATKMTPFHIELDHIAEFPCAEKMTPFHIESDHIAMGYHYPHRLKQFYNSIILIHFKITKGSCNIKECGVRLFYDKGYTEEKGEEVEGEQHSKRLKVSTAIEG